jgi:hypothetical protein
MDRRIRYWLIGTILLLAIYAVIFLFRKNSDLVRINFSHGILADHQRRINTVRECAADLGRAVGILTKGDQDGVYGVTNALKIVEVGQVV